MRCIKFNSDNVMLYHEYRDGKVYIVFMTNPNHICGQIAIADQGKLPPEAGVTPEEQFAYFLEIGYKGRGR